MTVDDAICAIVCETKVEYEVDENDKDDEDEEDVERVLERRTGRTSFTKQPNALPHIFATVEMELQHCIRSMSDRMRLD